MTAFSAEWLALREPADARSRSHVMTSLLASALRGTARPRIVDLGAGTGANFRYLAPRLGSFQEWVLADSDAALLGKFPECTRAWCARGDGTFFEDDGRLRLQGRGWECRLQLQRVDLAGRLGELQLARGSVVTASALLDLVSEDWLEALASRCHAARAVVLFALTYDGRMESLPAERDDGWIRDLVNTHQCGDKGFGVALGPAAAARAQSLFTELGYEVRCESSDWKLGPEDARLQQDLLAGCARAASAVAAHEAARCDTWLRRRLAHVAAGRSAITVGHRDLVARLP